MPCRPTQKSPSALVRTIIHPATAADRIDNRQGSQLLRALGLNADRLEEPVLAELSEVLRGDYREAPALPSPQMARRLAQVAKRGIGPGLDAWKQWHTAEDFRVSLPEFDSRVIAVHAEPYTRGAGLLLWGFSCDVGVAGDGEFVIFLNTAHQPGAVAATVAHELGHYIHRSIAPESCGTIAPLAADFASHLEDNGELFSDSLAALFAYSSDAMSKIRRARTGRIGEIIAALKAIDPEYRIDFAHPAVSPEWRVRYLAATIHFYKLRKALLETAGI